MSFLSALKDTIVSGAKFLFGMVKNVGPLKIIGIAATAVSIAIPVVKLVRKVFSKVKNRNKDKAPETMVEAAMASPKTRASNPELNYQYNESTNRTAKKVINGSRKKKRNPTITEMAENLRRYNSINAPKDLGETSMLAQIVDSDPALARHFQRQRKSPLRQPIRAT